MSAPTLRPYQHDACQSTAKALAGGLTRVLLKLPTGCHASGQGILLFSGRIKAVEDIEVGDALMGPDNTPRLVTSLARGSDEMVRIVPRKGSSWVVNMDHILTLKRTTCQKRPTNMKRRRDCKDGSVVDVSVRDWLTWSKSRKHVYKLWRQPASFPHHMVLVDPYILGLLLGDGSLKGNFGFSNIDPEPLEAIRQYASANGLRLEQLEPPREATYTFRSLVKWERSPLTISLRRFGLFPISGDRRFVPDVYKRNDQSVRLGVLAGLIDSDGSSTGGGFEYSTKSERLAKDVAFIARSVGLAAYIHPRVTRSQHGTPCDSFRVTISGDCGIVPCRVPRKRQGARRQKKDVLVTGLHVEPVGVGDYYGFSLTGDGRYLLDDFTVTHNTGKTVLFATFPSVHAGWLAQFAQTERRMMVIAHREELLDQAADKIQKANPALVVNIEQGDRVASPYADIVIASIQTLSAMKFRRLERLLARMVFRIVVVDEAHHAAARTYRAVLARMGFLPLIEKQDADAEIEAVNFDDVQVMEDTLRGWDQTAPKDRLLVGVTATPNRSDTIGLNCVFQDIVYSYALRDAIADGWLVPPVPFVIETDTSLDDVKTTAGDFNQKQLAQAVNQAHRNELAVKGWLEYGDRQPTLCFTVDVAHAHAMADLFQTVGVRAVALSGETPKEDRRVLLRQYQDRQVDLIANCMVLTEGTDLPLTGCILHCKPTKSATLYEQMTGRGLRLFDQKTRCVIIDVVDVARRHSLQTLPTLGGLPPGLKGNGETLQQLSDEWDDLQEKYPQLGDLLTSHRLTIEQLRVRASTFDIWSIPDLGVFAETTTLRWMKHGDDTFTLVYPWGDGKETLQVSRDLLGKWEIVCTIRPDDHGPLRQRTIAHGIEHQLAAASLAEAFVGQERRTILKLKDRSAQWRDGQASEKQMATLRKFHVPFDLKTLTKGRASDLLDIAFSRLNGRR